jgi:glycosyltransferase 2 family protein
VHAGFARAGPRRRRFVEDGLRDRTGLGVTTAARAGDGEARLESRSWTLALLLPAEPGRRNRRTIDGILVAATSGLVGLEAVVARSAAGTDEDIGRAFATLLGWAPGLWRAVLVVTLALAAVIVAEALVRRRWMLVRDLFIALLVANAGASVLARIVDSDWLQLEADPLAQWGFPELRIACCVAVLAVARPELVRPVRVVALWLVGLASVGVLALEIALPADVLAGLALGLGAASLVRLAFGSPLGAPPIDRVRGALGSLGIQISDLRIAERQRIGATEYFGHGDDGGSLKVRVLGRDAQDTQRLARRWRLLAYRDPPRSAPIGRIEQVEHEALATLMAAQAGVRVPDVVTAGLGSEGDALLVTRQPDLTALELASPDQVSDELLGELWRQVARLHDAGISHGRLNVGNVIVVDGGPMLVDLSAASLGAPQSALDMDVAELLVSCCVLVGPERTLRQAVDAGWSGSVSRVLPYLQRAALTPHLRDLARAHEVDLKRLREAAAAATGSAEPEIAPLRRVRLKDVLTMAALIFAAYVLITRLAQIGFDTIARELRDAEVAWVVVALIIAQSAFVGSGISVRGAVPGPLALLPCVVLQSAIKFINLTVPSSAGRIGMNMRFLQRMGVPSARALAAGAVDDVSETMVQLALLLVALPLVGASVDTSQFQGPDTGLVVGIAVALAISLVAVVAVPKLREKVLPDLKSALSGVWSVARDRHKRIELFGGNVLSELTYSIALGATCLAYGIDLNLAQLVFVNASAAVLSSVIPSPGGIGPAEAALAAGLIAMGVDESTAFAVAITQRLCTFYFPPIWGYFSLRWLARHGYV